MSTTAVENIDQDYVEIASSTGSIYVSSGKVSLTIQESQPNKSAPVMAVIRSGEDRPIKVPAGKKLYGKSATNLGKTSVTYTEV